MRNIPAGYEVLFEDKDFNIQVFWQATTGRAMGFSGRKERKDFFFRYRDLDHLKRDTKERFDRRLAELREAKARKCAETCLQAGDIIRVSWGHDQTNVEAYKVLARSGKRKVWLQSIGIVKSYSDGFDDRGTCVPDETKTFGEAFSKMADDKGYVSLESYMAGGPWPKSETGDYLPTYWSSYA
jgi:hypothetical protein